MLRHPEAYNRRLTSSSHLNTYGGNTLSGNAAVSACAGTVKLGDFCDDSTNNASFGNNLVPTLPVF